MRRLEAYQDNLQRLAHELTNIAFISSGSVAPLHALQQGPAAAARPH